MEFYEIKRRWRQDSTIDKTIGIEFILTRHSVAIT